MAEYDRANRGWMDILMKMASWKSLGDAHGKDVTPRVEQMFFMVSTDVAGVWSFVFETSFLDARSRRRSWRPSGPTTRRSCGWA